LLITGDHGCDPGDESTDHTREYTPLLMVGAGITPENYGTRDTFADIAATVTRYLDVPFDGAGNSLI
jgi:phosphopentomutase